MGKYYDIKMQNGISLITIIITIIVIIILAAIVIFSGFTATDSAEFAKFCQEFSSYKDELQDKLLDNSVSSSINHINEDDSEDYAKLGTYEGTLNDILGVNIIVGEVKGTKCYQLSTDKKLYENEEARYITDMGDIFTFPGYRYMSNGEERYYITENDYVLSNIRSAIRICKDDDGSNTWDLLKNISDKISKDSTITEESTSATVKLDDGKEYVINAGDVFKIEYDGTPVDVIVLGFNHDLKEDGSKAGITFMFDNILDISWNNKTEYKFKEWGTSFVRTSTIGTLESKIAESAKKYIASVKKSSAKGAPNSWTTEETIDKLWLLSCSEIYPRNVVNDASFPGIQYAYSPVEEGKQYAYFKHVLNIGADVFGKSNEKLIKEDLNGKATWLLRSPFASSLNFAVYFNNFGRNQYYYADESYGISPCFCI